MKEILIFCNTGKSKLDTSQFNKFLEQYKIRINLRIVQISQEDLTTIQKDNIGSKDLLGFSSILNHKVTYGNGFSVDLLNNDKSNQIILHNYDQYEKEVAEQHSLTVQEPSYIESNNDPGAERRIRDPHKK